MSVFNYIFGLSGFCGFALGIYTFFETIPVPPDQQLFIIQPLWATTLIALALFCGSLLYFIAIMIKDDEIHDLKRKIEQEKERARKQVVKQKGFYDMENIK